MWTVKSYSAVFEWVDFDRREDVRLILLADGLNEVVERLDNSHTLRDWYQITAEAARAVGPEAVERLAWEAIDSLAHDAQMLNVRLYL